MDNQNIPEFLNNAFIICLVLAITFLVVAIVLYFALHIRDVAYELSGKARADVTKKMQENYAVTGSLRQSDCPGMTAETASGKIERGSGGLFLTGRLPEVGERQEKPKQEAQGTTALGRRDAPVKKEPPASEKLRTRNPNFKVNKELILIHTEERIS